MNQQDRTRLQRLCTELRAETWPTWDAAGTEAALLELDKRMPTDPLGVAVRALTAARNPGNRGPATMLQEPEREAVVRTITPAARPSTTDPACKDCGSQLRTPLGECVGCLQDLAAGRGPGPVSPAPPSLRPACPPPVGLRERVAAALNQGPL